MKKKNRNITRIFCRVVLVAYLVSCSFILTGCGGRSISYDKSYEKIDKTIIFSEKMLYKQNIKPRIAGKEQVKYNRSLFREGQDWLGTHHYINNTKIHIPIKIGMCFKVVKSYEVIPWGLQKEFSSQYRILVLEDEDSLLSTILESSVDETEYNKCNQKK